MQIQNFSWMNFVLVKKVYHHYYTVMHKRNLMGIVNAFFLPQQTQFLGICKIRIFCFWRETSLYLTTWDQGIINIVWKEKNPAVPYAVGWSDLALFCDSWKATHFCRSGIFLGAEFQNIGNFRIHMRASQEQQSFHFQRITGTLQINIFFNICRNCPFTAKNNS